MILGQPFKYISNSKGIYDYDCYCSNEDVLTYVEQIEAALHHGLVTYIAHPDYFMQGRRLFSKECEEAAHRIAKASLKYDIPLEVNLNGFNNGKKHMKFIIAMVSMRRDILTHLKSFGKLFHRMAVKCFMVMMLIHQ